MAVETGVRFSHVASDVLENAFERVAVMHAHVLPSRAEPVTASYFILFYLFKEIHKKSGCAR